MVVGHGLFRCFGIKKDFILETLLDVGLAVVGLAVVRRAVVRLVIRLGVISLGVVGRGVVGLVARIRVRPAGLFPRATLGVDQMLLPRGSFSLPGRPGCQVKLGVAGHQALVQIGRLLELLPVTAWHQPDRAARPLDLHRWEEEHLGLSRRVRQRARGVWCQKHELAAKRGAGRVLPLRVLDRPDGPGHGRVHVSPDVCPRTMSEPSRRAAGADGDVRPRCCMFFGGWAHVDNMFHVIRRLMKATCCLMTLADATDIPWHGGLISVSHGRQSPIRERTAATTCIAVFSKSPSTTCASGNSLPSTLQRLGRSSEATISGTPTP